MQKINIKSYEDKNLEIKSQIDKLRPFSENQLKNLQNWFRISFTAHSNWIELNEIVSQLKK